MHPLTRHKQLAAAAILSSVLFIALAFLRTNALFIKIDHVASHTILLLRNDGLTRMIVIFTEIFSIPFMAIFIAGSAIMLLWSDKKLALRLVITAAVGATLFSFIKLVIHASRPLDGLIDAPGFSFPSGHATMATILFVFIARLFERASKSLFFHLLFNLFAMCMIVAVSLSRIYLGVHWLSDVLAGMLLGVFSTSIVTMEFDRFGSRLPGHKN
jgi:undecaprenyl-diphosphatase